MKNSLDIFFSKSLEDETNTYLLENDFVFPHEEILEYIKELINIDISDYLLWLDQHFGTIILSVEDAIQYSNFEDATVRIVEKLISAGDLGYSHIEIGKFLQNDGITRKDGANTKYGENHAKTAQYLGYVFSINRCYYVSSVGYILNELSGEEQDKLFARLFIRTNLFKTVYYLSKSGNVCLRDIFDMLSEKTYIRRRSNIKFLFQKLTSKEQICTDITNKIIY